MPPPPPLEPLVRLPETVEFTANSAVLSSINKPPPQMCRPGLNWR